MIRLPEDFFAHSLAVATILTLMFGVPILGLWLNGDIK